MKLTVEVKTNAKKEGVEKTEDNIFIVRVNVPPVEGKANKRVIALLAKYLKKPKSAFEITGGLKSKRKTIKLES